MSAHSKNAWLAFGLSVTAAGTAYAAIPDANGVIHGCYNVLTGSSRIIDGNSCGLLEKAITWQQTGPRGPAGPQGPTGPQGPAGTPNMLFGTGFFRVNTATAPFLSTHAYDETVGISAPSHAVCALTITGSTFESPGQYTIAPSFRRDDSQAVDTGQTGVLAIYDFDSHGPGGIRKQAAGTVTDYFDIEAGRTYNFGVELQSTAPVNTATEVYVTMSWWCKY